MKERGEEFAHLYPLCAGPRLLLYRVEGGELTLFCRSSLGSFIFLGCGLLYVSSLPMKLDIP